MLLVVQKTAATSCNFSTCVTIFTASGIINNNDVHLPFKL